MLGTAPERIAMNRCFLLFAVVCLAGTLTSSAQPQIAQPMLTCRGLTVVNDEGKPVVSIGSVDSGGAISISSENGKSVRIFISTDGITMSNRDKKQTVSLGCNPEGFISLSDAAQKGSVSMSHRGISVGAER
jgi:hypothetical protein